MKSISNLKKEYLTIQSLNSAIPDTRKVMPLVCCHTRYSHSTHYGFCILETFV